MSTLLERLLEWLAALGSPVIILSSTLPKKKRDALIKAYLKGLGKTVEVDRLTEIGADRTYPRISYATAATDDKTFKVRHLETSPQNTKTLHLEWKDETNFIDELKAKLENGGCAAIICNTVDKAQTLYSKLSSDNFFAGKASDGEPKLDLLHARFRYRDREVREQRSLKRFGKPDTDGKSPHRPQTAVLISTQIIEQSLDLDFDLMISELAPADLLLQRAGRLQRHNRDRLAKFKEKTALWLIKPSKNADGDLVDKDKLPDFGKSVFVYDEHILLRSWLRLYKENDENIEIKIPEGIENLIEDTYDTEQNCFDVEYEKVWDKTLAAYKKDLSDEETEAEERWIAKPLVCQELYQIVGRQKEQLEEDSLAFHEKIRALTRLNADSIKIICLYGSESKPFLDADGVKLIDIKNVVSSKNDDEQKEAIIDENIRQLLYNSIPINRRDLILAVLRAEETKILSEWEKSPLLKSCRVLWLDEDSSAEIENFSIYLHSKLGLRVHKSKEENNG
jgi:CRISPR-associated endonuclease/helicase Cas3